MAKTAKLKRNAKSTSLHSRASRRAASPLPKSSLLPTATPPTNPSILSTHHASGIAKRKSKTKPLSRQKRRRKEIGVEKAEVVLDRREQKVERSLGRSRVIKERSAAWEDLNGKIEGRKRKGVGKGDGGKGGDADVDGAMEVEGVATIIPEVIDDPGDIGGVTVADMGSAEPTGLITDEIT